MRTCTVAESDNGVSQTVRFPITSFWRKARYNLAALRIGIN